MPGVTVKDDFTDFEFSCDFNMVSPLWAAEPVLCAKGEEGFYLFQIVADNRHQFWPTIRAGGQWQIDKIADESGVNPQLGEWYSIKIIVEGGVETHGVAEGYACVLHRLLLQSTG